MFTTVTEQYAHVPVADIAEAFMSHPIVGILDQAFPPLLRTAFVECLKTGCRAASNRFSEADGSNAFTFGTDAYHFNTFRLKRLTKGTDLGLVLSETSSDLEFRIRVAGKFNLACHRVGSTADQPITDSFPSSPGGPGRMARQNAEQLNLGLEYPPLAAHPENVVLAYMANPDSGLEAVYLAVPVGSSDGGRINAWAYTEAIWRWDEGHGHGISTADIPPEVPVEDAPIALRPNVISR